MGEGGVVFNYTFESCLFVLKTTELCRNIVYSKENLRVNC